jgi:ankyrin repeat protein
VIRFRWAACQLDTIVDCLDYSQLKEALASLPATLDATYARILETIPRAHRQKSLRMLQVLTWAERPLRIEEAIDFLAVSLGDHDELGFNVKNRMPRPKEILVLCSSLITITHTSGRRSKHLRGSPDEIDADGATDQIQLAHFSVKEYFTSGRLDRDYFDYLSEMSAAACIARVSLIYLSQLQQDVIGEQVKLRFPLAKFAAQYWVRFARHAEDHDQSVVKLELRLLSTPELYSTWLSLHLPEKPWKDTPKPLYHASLGGLAGATNSLIARGAEVNAQGGRYGYALHAACARGHAKVVELLLARNADISAYGGLYGFALQTACAKGHERVVEILLLHNAEVNAYGGKYGRALHAGCAVGHLKVVEALLYHNADVNAQGGFHRYALHTACMEGHEDVVETLLHHNAEVNALGGRYSSALQTACAKGYEKIAMKLLECKADVHAKGGYYGNALQAACAAGSERMVKVLLEKGVDVNAQGGHYGNSLQAACAAGHANIAEVLLEHRAEANANGGEFDNALQAACAGGYEMIVRTLLHSGADANAEIACSRHFEREKRQSAMYMTFSRPRMEATLGCKGSRHGNALQIACAEGHEKVVALLLHHDAKVNTGSGEYGNALQAACFKGHEKIVQALLDKRPNANIDARGGPYGINARGGRYGDALGAALAGNHPKVIETLLKMGATHKSTGGGERRIRVWGRGCG